jgi:hypothetical protein
VPAPDTASTATTDEQFNRLCDELFLPYDFDDKAQLLQAKEKKKAMRTYPVCPPRLAQRPSTTSEA